MKVLLVVLNPGVAGANLLLNRLFIEQTSEDNCS
jgi:hypothetical protein